MTKNSIDTLFDTFEKCRSRNPQKIAETVTSDKDLWPSIRDRLALLKLAELIKLYLRQSEPQEDTQQFKLPGFENIQPVLRMGGRKAAIPVATANLEQVIAYRDWYRNSIRASDKQKKQRLRELNKLVSLMEKHTKRNPEITVQQALALEQPVVQKA